MATEVARTSTASAAPTRTRRLTHLLAAPVYSFYTARLRHEVERLPLPAHVAVILDGNRRWASLAGLQEAAEGHRAGADKLDELLDWCVRLGIRQVTVWALSNENLGRSEAELSGLLDVVADKLRSLAELHGRQSVRIRVYGRHEEFPERLRVAISSAEEATAENDGLRLNIALGYSGRDELVDATRALVKRLAADELDPATMAQRITPEAIAVTSLHGRRARSRPDHPHERRGSPERLPPLAGSAQRALLHGRLLARAARARLPARAADVPAPHAPVRALASSAVRVTLLGQLAHVDPVPARELAQLPAVDRHVRVGPVAVRLAAPGRVELLVVRARQALVVADDVAELDPELLRQPERQLERGGELARVVQDVRVAVADVLDPDRRPVEADGVPAARGQVDELVDRPVRVDDEVRARPGQLVQLGVSGSRTRRSRRRSRSSRRCSARRSRGDGRGATAPCRSAASSMRPSRTSASRRRRSASRRCADAGRSRRRRPASCRPERRRGGRRGRAGFASAEGYRRMFMDPSLRNIGSHIHNLSRAVGQRPSR